MDFLFLLTLYRDEVDEKISTEKDHNRGKRRDREIENKRAEKGAIRERSILLIWVCSV
jgi:hypothetical protein